ncbi:MAG TPA: hypothetical protein VGF73_03355 [Chthoniobacterales bacterium]|jgi:hypothetical protein
MKKSIHAIALFLLAATLFSSCSMLTAQGRRERAYEHYVRKSSLGRLKQQRRLSFKKAKIPFLPPSEPAETTSVSGPESVTDGGSL